MKAARHFTAFACICAQRLVGARVILFVLRHLWKPGYVFLVYPGTEADVTHVMPRWLAGSRWVRSNPALIGFVTGGVSVRRGLVFAISNTTRQLVQRESRVELLLIKRRLERIAALLRIETIAMAGQLPAIMTRRSVFPEKCVQGLHGTVYSIDATIEELNPGDRSDLRGVILGMGYVGAAVQRLLGPQLHRLDGIDHRRHCGVITPDDPAYQETLARADTIIALTPRGKDAVPHLGYANEQALIVDDTHPRLVQEDLNAHQAARTFKVALSSGATFIPRLPRYESGWLPGCALEAQVLSSCNQDVGCYDEFKQAAQALGVRALKVSLAEDWTSR